MKPWIMPCITAIVFATIALPVLWIVRMYEREERDRTQHYLSIRVEDVDKGNIDEHVKSIYSRYQVESEWAIPKIKEAVIKYPNGRLFLYNTSEEQWRNLGGEIGYAIVQDNKIVWKRRLKIS